MYINTKQPKKDKKGILKTLWPTLKFLIVAGVFGLAITLADQHWSERKRIIQDIKPWVGEWSDQKNGVNLTIERECTKLVVRSIEAVNADIKPNKIYKNAENSCIIECTNLENNQSIKLYIDRPGGGGIKYSWGSTFVGPGEGIFFHK